MKNYTIEYESHWSDGVIDYEQTLNVKAKNEKLAEIKGREELSKMDENDNKWFHCVRRKYYRTVLEKDFQYNSSVKEDSSIYKDAGYIDITKWKGL